MARDEHAFGEDHVDRRRPELTAQVAAGVYRVGEDVRVAQIAPRLFHLALFDQRADIARADGPSVERDGRDHVAAQTVCGAIGPEFFGGSFPMITEAEIVPDHDMRDVQLF